MATRKLILLTALAGLVLPVSSRGEDLAFFEEMDQRKAVSVACVCGELINGEREEIEFSPAPATPRVLPGGIDDPETRDRIIADAVPGSDVEVRDERGKELKYERGKQMPFTGWVKLMYRTGRVQILEQYKDGKKDGLAVWWYENGQKRWESSFVDGRASGLWRAWYDNGQLGAQGTSRDRQQGKAKFWDREGHPCTAKEFNELWAPPQDGKDLE